MTLNGQEAKTQITQMFTHNELHALHHGNTSSAEYNIDIEVEKDGNAIRVYCTSLTDAWNTPIEAIQLQTFHESLREAATIIKRNNLSQLECPNVSEPLSCALFLSRLASIPDVLQDEEFHKLLDMPPRVRHGLRSSHDKLFCDIEEYRMVCSGGLQRHVRSVKEEEEESKENEWWYQLKRHRDNGRSVLCCSHHTDQTILLSLLEIGPSAGEITQFNDKKYEFHLKHGKRRWIIQASNSKDYKRWMKPFGEIKGQIEEKVDAEPPAPGIAYFCDKMFIYKEKDTDDDNDVDYGHQNTSFHTYESLRGGKLGVKSSDKTQKHVSKGETCYFCPSVLSKGKGCYQYCRRDDESSRKSLIHVCELCMKQMLQWQQGETCFVEMVIHRLEVSENLETGNGQCEIQMSVRLYWDDSRLHVNEIDQCPKIKFRHTVGKVEPYQVKMSRGVKIDVFSADPFNSSKKQSNEESKDAANPNDTHGYMGCVEYDCDIVMEERFELNAFPFDCQDIPIYIAAENFETFAPAYLHEGKPFISMDGEATDLGNWIVNSTMIEFNTNDSKDEIRVMIKIKREYMPYFLKYVFLIGCVSILSLSSYSLDLDDKPDKVATVLGLILTLIFIDIPRLPVVTFLDGYYFTSFMYLVAVTAQNAIGDLGIIDLFHHSDLWMLQSSNKFWSVAFLCIFLFYHMLFIFVAAFIIAKENKKLSMTWREIQTVVAEQYLKLGAKQNTDYSIELKDPNDTGLHVYRTKQLNPDNEIHSHNVIQQSLTFNNGCLNCIAIPIWVIGVLTIFCLPVVASFMQWALIESKTCIYFDTHDLIEVRWTMVLFLLCVIEVIMIIVVVAMVRGSCCFKTTALSTGWSMFIAVVAFSVSVLCYIMAIHNYTFWFHHSNIQCEIPFYESLVQHLFGIWVALYTVGYILCLVALEIVIQNDVDNNRYYNQRVFCVWNCTKFLTKLSEMCMVFLTIIIQIPTCIVQLILIWDIDMDSSSAQCTASYVNITTAEAVVLLILSYLFIGIRSISHKLDHEDAPTYIVYTFFYQVIQILSIHCFAYWTHQLFNCENKYHQPHQGDMTQYVHLSFYLWIIYDCGVSIVCVILYLFGDITDIDRSAAGADSRTKWLWYTFFIGLLCVQLPVALLQLGQAWLYLNNGLLVFNSIVIILCVWCALMIFQYPWMYIMKHGEYTQNKLKHWVTRSVLACVVGLCFILSIHSFTLVSPDHFIWYLLLVCIIIYSLLSLYVVVSIFTGLCGSGIGWFKQVYNTKDIITVYMTTILFLLQIIAALFQLDHLENESCSVPPDGNTYSKAEAMALLVFTVLQYAPAFDILLYNVADTDAQKIGRTAILIMSVVEFAIMIHSVVFWSQDGLICDVENHSYAWFTICIVVYILMFCWLMSLNNSLCRLFTRVCNGKQS
eukprot:557041_1